MDPLPQIPITRAINDTARLIRNAFEEQLEKDVFPKDTATNLITYSIDENLSLTEAANNVIRVYRWLKEESENLNSTEYDIIKQHEVYISTKNVLEKNQLLKEIMKLRSCDIFRTLPLSDKMRYGLIEKCDLYPDVIRQFLDFRFNTSFHQCKRCFPAEERANQITPPIGKSVCITPIVKNDMLQIVRSLQLEPSEIVFKNFELKTTYEQTVYIKNISTQMQRVSIRSYPKSMVFNLVLDAGQKIAPGLWAVGKIMFTPESFVSLQDCAVFISRKGEVVSLPIRCHRDPPHLLAFIQKSNEIPKFDSKTFPGSKHFSAERQRALNNTIDCGTCFITEHVLISLVLTNKGNNAKFFWLSEEDFCHQNINSVSKSFELMLDSFWIYPTYFEMKRGDVCEVNILFHPLHCGLQTEMLYLMCDNNTYQQIELIGDGLCFNKNMISVGIRCGPKEIEKKKGHCIFLGHIGSKERKDITLFISNRSSVLLKYDLKSAVEDDKFSMSKWIQVANSVPTSLAPYSTSDVIVQVECPDDVPEGYYNAKLRLFIVGIPITSLKAEDTFVIRTNGKPFKQLTEDNMSAVDILVMEAEVAAYADSQKMEIAKPLLEPFTCQKYENLNCNCNCSCADCNESIPQADLEFCQSFLEFGLLPIGVDIKKDFQITNLGEHDLKWRIVELKYNIDSYPFVEVVQEKNMSSYEGILQPHKKHSITYNIIGKKSARHVSLLVLFLVEGNQNADDNNFIAESICVVTYEIVELNIGIQTSQSPEPILCPIQMLYTGVPVSIVFKIHNYSPISGCFYFLKPIGSDADKVKVEYKPQAGELNPGSTKKIQLKLICNELGILENIFLPCFIGKDQKPIQVRLLCVVDCIHVFFYLSTRNNEFQKVLWPPKVIYEYDRSWSDYCLCEELPCENENTINDIQDKQKAEMESRSNETFNAIKERNSLTIGADIKSVESSSSDLLKTFTDMDSETFLQDCIMEVRGVNNKEPKKITIYFENITPKSAKYSIQCTNYGATKNRIKLCLGPKYQKTEDIWESMVGDYGIVVHPEVESGFMEAHELISVDIWIYANTWGIYAEEIIIDIENIIPFTFSMLIEVVGCPLELPLSIRAVTKYPTIRFGSVAFQSDPITREVLIRNISSVDVTVSWHVFYFNEDSDSLAPFNFICDVVQNAEEQFEFNFTDKFFGVENTDSIEVQPSKLEIKHHSRLKILLIFKPNFMKCNNNKCELRCFLLGRIFLKEKDRLKSNYFYRKNNSLVIEVTATLEIPHLDVEIENEILQLYANDVILKRQTVYHIKCLVRNPTSSTIKAELECPEPFSLRKTDSSVTLEAGKCKEIHLSCIMSYEKILKLASYVYRMLRVEETQPDQNSNVQLWEDLEVDNSDEKNIDDCNKILTFHRNILVCYQGGLKNEIPLNISIHYPNIAIKPVHVKFGYVLLGRTQKAMVSIFNLTGCIVLFEVYKSLSTQELVVTPYHGEIERSTGTNHNFTNLTIFFTPTKHRTYHESIRVVTNIPQYYIDIPIKGTGSYNEKFC